MDKNQLYKWKSEKRYLENQYFSIVGNPIRIYDIDPLSDEIGYTSKDNRIYLAYYHQIMENLSDDEQMIFRQGVFTHEMMHKIFSNFTLLEETIKKYQDKYEKKLFALINNIVEDPAIEYFADTVIGGTLLNSLNYSISHIYSLSPHISSSTSPFEEIVNALIQFGDMGVVKGLFSSSETSLLFAKIAPIMIKAIKEIDPEERIKYSMQIVEMIKDILPKENEENLYSNNNDENNENNKNESEESNEKNNNNNSDNDSNNSNDSNENNNKKSDIANEKSNDNNLDGDFNEGSDSNSDKSSISDKENNSTEKSGNINCSAAEKLIDNLIEKLEENGKFISKGDVNEIYIKPEVNIDDSESSKFNKEKMDKINKVLDNINNLDLLSENDSQICPQIFSEIHYEDFSTEKLDLYKDFDITDKLLEEINNNIEEMVEEIICEELREEENARRNVNYDIEIPVINYDIKCMNNIIKLTDFEIIEAQYQKIFKGIYDGVNILYRELKKIFMNDVEEKIYKSSGKIDFSRVNNNRVTPRIFEKRHEPENKDDICVMILIDESGSMKGKRINEAKIMAIGLSEVMAKLNIPTYIMGFTANKDGYQAYHNHYLQWTMAHNDRLKLLNISANCNNFDGYSIRYAAKIIEEQKKNTKHKLMFVISDGQPNAQGYSGSIAINDTCNAIRETKNKNIQIIGVALGENDTDILQNMYGNDFLFVPKSERLFIDISKKIKDVIKNW